MKGMILTTSSPGPQDGYKVQSTRFCFYTVEVRKASNGIYCKFITILDDKGHVVK